MDSVISKQYTSSPYTRRLLREERHRWDPRVAKHKEAQQPPAESEVYTGCGRIGKLVKLRALQT